MMLLACTHTHVDQKKQAPLLGKKILNGKCHHDKIHLGLTLLPTVDQTQSMLTLKLLY